MSVQRDRLGVVKREGLLAGRLAAFDAASCWRQ